MSLLTILVVLIVVGVVLYLVNNYIPMDGKIKTILNVFIVVVLIVWLLSITGVFHYLGGVKILN
jgi:hypothetical protein